MYVLLLLLPCRLIYTSSICILYISMYSVYSVYQAEASTERYKHKHKSTVPPSLPLLTDQIA